MVVIMLAGVMSPLWPIQLRIGVWYLSIGVPCLVGLFIALAIVRLIDILVLGGRLDEEGDLDLPQPV